MSKKHTLEGRIETRRVILDGAWLDPKPSQGAYNHSPDGFNWGYGGSGPAQLALAVLMKLMMDDGWALDYHQDFKWWLICHLPFNEDFEIEFDFADFLDYVREKHNG